MSRNNIERKNCKDVFNSFLVDGASYAGIFEFPRINPTYCIPNKVIPFSKAVSCNDYDQWIHFYEDDYLFERVWRTPNRYLDLFSKYSGVILPDFSLYRDMPLSNQLWNIYRSRAIGYWLQTKGIEVIPNIRFGDKRTYKICCCGIEKNSVISVGSHGTFKLKEDRTIFLKGLDEVVKILEPKVIVVYGAAPNKFFDKYKDLGIEIVQFDSDYATSHKGVE